MQSTERRFDTAEGCRRALDRHRARLKDEDRRAGRSPEAGDDRFLEDEPDRFLVLLSWDVEAHLRRYECRGTVLLITDTGHLPTILPPEIR
jgi:hypothetical protein